MLTGARGRPPCISSARSAAGRQRRSRAALDAHASAAAPATAFGQKPDAARRAPATSTSSSISASASARANGFAASPPAPRFATPPGRWRPASSRFPAASAAAAFRRPIRGSARARHRAARLWRRHRPPHGADRRGRAACRPPGAADPRPSRTLGRGDGFARVLERAGVAAAPRPTRSPTLVADVVPLDDIRPGTVDGRDARPPAEPHRRPPARRARPSAPASTSSSSLKRAGRRARPHPHPDRGRRHAAAHPGPGRRQPLPLGPRRRRSGQGGRSLYPRARQPDQHRRPQLATTASTSSSSIAAPPPARPRPASCSMPASTAAVGQGPAADAVGAGRPRRMVRGLGRRPRERRACSGRCRARLLQFRPADATRSSAIRGCTAASISAPATERRSSPPPTAGSPRAGWAGGYGQQVRLAHAGGLATSYSHMSRIAARAGIDASARAR